MQQQIESAHAELAALFPGKTVTLQVRATNYQSGKLYLSFVCFVKNLPVAEAKSLSELIKYAETYALAELIDIETDRVRNERGVSQPEAGSQASAAS